MILCNMNIISSTKITTNFQLLIPIVKIIFIFLYILYTSMYVVCIGIVRGW